MNGIDLVKMSVKGIGYFAVPSVFFLSAAFFLCISACSGVYTMQKEKGAPCRVVVFADHLESADVERMESVEEVMDATLVYEVYASIQEAELSAEFVLQGMEPAFIQGEFLAGGVFAENTGMPYIVCNEAAISTLKDQKGEVLPEEEIRTENWLDQTVMVTVGDRSIAAKICGVLKDGTENAAVFISRDWAKELMRRSGMEAEAAVAWVDLQSAGAMQRVQEQLQAYGYMAETQDTAQLQGWDIEQVKVHGWTGAAGIAFAAFCFLLWEKVREDEMVNEREYGKLQRLHLRKGNIRRQMNGIRITVIFLTGAVGGWCLYAVLAAAYFRTTT